MSVLVVGLSHKSASLATLERAMVSGDALGKLLRDVFQAENVAGTFVVSTCNRAEVYADVDKFHGGVAVICELLARHSGIPLDELTPHLYVHYEDRAVQHLLAVTCGLESMVVGESQIIGRARHETGIDGAGASLVSVGLTVAAERLRAPADVQRVLAGLSVLVVGAGSMSSLAVATATRMGAAPIMIANRTHDHAKRLAATVCGASADLSDLPAQ